MAAYRVLEVTLISANDLKKVTVFSKMRVYAVASISGGDPRMPTHRTHCDRQGGRSPTWHAPLRFPIPAAADPRGLALHVLLRAERAFGDRDVGEVFVPVQDLVAAAPAGGEHRHLSYQVRLPMSGRKHGVLHISYSLTDVPAPAPVDGPGPYAQYIQQDAAAKRKAKGGGGGGADPVTAYPPYHQHHTGMPPYHGHHAYGHGYHHPYGYGAVGPSYGYGPGAAPYGYGAPSAAHGGGGAGMGAGLGLGLLGGAVGGIVVGDMLADSEMDAAYGAGFADGIGMDGGDCASI